MEWTNGLHARRRDCGRLAAKHSPSRARQMRGVKPTRLECIASAVFIIALVLQPGSFLLLWGIMYHFQTRRKRL